MEIATRQHVRMLSGEVARMLSRFHWHWQFVDARCLMKNDDHGPQGITPPVIPYASYTRDRVVQPPLSDSQMPGPVLFRLVERAGG